MKAHCVLCGSRRSKALFRGRDWLHGQATQSEVLRCEECGLVFLWPQPHGAADIYPDEYAPHVGPDGSATIAWSVGHRAGLLRKVGVVREYGSGPLLDVGCAAGEFLAAVRGETEGPVFGTDISEKALRRARQRFGVTTWVGEVPGLPLPDGFMGTVTLWHVLEHLPQPQAALCDVARILRADGVAIVACPMVDSWEAKLFGRYWAGYDVPRHLYSFSRRTLARMLRSAGFEPHEVLHVVRGYNSAKISSAFWLQRSLLLRSRPRLLRLIAAALGAALAVAFEVLSRLLTNRRAVAVFVARKHPDRLGPKA